MSAHKLLQCKAMGIAKNQGRADFAREERFPLPLSLLTNEKKLQELQAAIDSADKRTRFVLERALALTGMHLLLENAQSYNWARYQILRGAEKDLRQLKTTQDEIENWMRFSGVARAYWTLLDIPFMRFLEKLGRADEETLPEVRQWWQQVVRHSAETAFHNIRQYTNQTPRAFKALAHGNNYLQGYLNKNFPIHKKEVPTA